jgi:aryl-alcohol dehydrogenase-like predicted oxidoreductase
MERRRLGQTGLAITPIGLGTWAIGGGDWCLGWGPQRDSDSIATIRRAVALGINWIDTAGAYGLGRAEVIISRALRGFPRSVRPLLFTTGGFVWDDLGNVARDLSAQSIRRQVDGSLRRLGADVIDLYQLDPTSGADCALPALGGSLEDAWATLAMLQQEGKVRAIGVTNCSTSQLARLWDIAPVASVQTRYSLLRRDAETDLLPLCAARGIAVLAASPMESGLLTGTMTAERWRRLPHNDWRRWCARFHADEIPHALRITAGLREIGHRHGVGPGAMAVAWTLQRCEIVGAIVGARTPQQIDALAPAAPLRLSGAELAELQDLSIHPQMSAR